MAEVETGQEYQAFRAVLDRLGEGGLILDDEDDLRAFEIVWCAGRDWAQESQTGA